ncbi:MAG: formyltransferase family protein [PVC group bacterium]
MKIIILTQNEGLYLPKSFARICREFPGEIVCIVSAPAMSTHGGAVKGLVRHLRLFGWRGTAIMGGRVIKAAVLSRLTRPGIGGSFHSIRQVARVFRMPYYEIDRVKSREFQNLLTRYRPELLISISCPQIIGKAIRERLPRGCINVHGAPLPRYRGLMPAFWVLRNGESRTAVTVHDLAAKLDDGDIILQREVEISPEDTWDSLVRKTKAAGAEVLVDAIRLIKEGKAERRPNREEDSTYFSFPTAKDRKIFRKAGRRFF